MKQEEIERLLDELASEERLEIFNEYCPHCGDKDPGCQCGNEE